MSAEAAAQWTARREDALAENRARASRRGDCLRDSTIVGAVAGVLGCAGCLRFVRARAAGQSFGARLWGSPLAWAFGAFVGFYMPFQFVSNVVRHRCQSLGLERAELGRSIKDETS